MSLQEERKFLKMDPDSVSEDILTKEKPLRIITGVFKLHTALPSSKKDKDRLSLIKLCPAK